MKTKRWPSTTTGTCIPSDPLCAGEEGSEGAAKRGLVLALSSSAASGIAKPFDLQDSPHEVTAEEHAQIASDMLAEVEETAAPSRPRIEHGLDVQTCRVAHRRCRRRRRLLPLFVRNPRGMAQPVLEGAEGHADGVREDVESDRSV